MFRERVVVIGSVTTIALALVIAVLTLSPAPAAGPPGSDKLYHIIAFASLALPLAFVRPRWVFWVVIGVLAYGGAIELIQPFFGRQAEWADFAVDGVGALLGAAIGYALSGVIGARSRPRKKARSSFRVK